jgi:hypothetical protein
MKLINNRELLGNQKDTMLGFLLIFLHFGDRVLLCSLDWPQTLDPLSSAPPPLSPSPPYWDYRHALSCLVLFLFKVYSKPQNNHPPKSLRNIYIVNCGFFFFFLSDPDI